MGYLERYTQRVESDGDGIGTSLKRQTDDFIQRRFSDAPNYRKVIVEQDNGDNTFTIDARLLEVDRMGSVRKLLLRPGEDLRLGSILDFDGDKWIAHDKFGSSHDNVGIEVEKINSTLRWIDPEDKLWEIPCKIGTSYLGSKSRMNTHRIMYNTYNVHLAEGGLMGYVERNELTRGIQLHQRFIFNDSVYEIVGKDDVSQVDRDGHGVLQLLLDKTTEKRNKDNFETGVAFNAYDTTDGLIVRDDLLSPDEDVNNEDEKSDWGW